MLISWFSFILIFFVSTLFTPVHAGNVAGGPCQLQARQNGETWPFDVEYTYETPRWSAEKTAVELQAAQVQYFAGKSSPFVKDKSPAVLAFYEPHAEFKIQPYVTYTQTLDARYCAQVVGAKLIINHRPEIFLARELAAKNCVSRAALAYQLKHDLVAVNALKSFVNTKEDVKKIIFPTYEQVGAAGKTPADVARQLSNMELSATHKLSVQFQANLRMLRQQTVETQRNLTELYSTCQGDFEIASQLAQPAENK